jgi:pimeloyl-ACP methyl ester carboxylesterase
MQTVTSKDGTKIAYKKSGKGPPVILVGGALVNHSADLELAELLARQLSVYSYDRRGRGKSTDTGPYSVLREIEDIAALIDVAGGSAAIYGISSGAALALEAASALGNKVAKLAIYEAPYDEAEDAPQKWKTFRSQLEKLLAKNQNAEAVELHLKFVGIPDEVLTKMKASPAWSEMTVLAPSLAYDAAILAEERSIPSERVTKIKTKDILIMDGGANLKTMPFMNHTANKLADLLPNALRLTVDGEGHNVSSKVLASILIEFFQEHRAGVEITL